MRTHLTLHDAQYTTIRRGQIESHWVSATINVFEVEEDTIPLPRSHCESKDVPARRVLKTIKGGLVYIPPIPRMPS